jgi:acyl dehydratase
MTVVVGDPVPLFRVEGVSAEKMKIMALLLHDPNPIHFDRAAVAAAGLGDREVNQGSLTLGYVFDGLIAWAGDRSAIRSLQCRFAANVFAGDDVVVSGTVTAVTASGGQQLVDCDVWADRSDGVRVISGRATVALPS